MPSQAVMDYSKLEFDHGQFFRPAGAKTSSTGTIFGSVNNIQIAEALEKLGFNVDRKTIILKEAVKEVGCYKALIKLHKEVSVEIPFEVVSE